MTRAGTAAARPAGAVSAFTAGAFAASVAALLAIVGATAQEAAEGVREVDGRKSGYLFLEPSTQQLQDDDFLNPAMFMVDTGRALWSRVEGTEGQACADCHGAAEDSMRGVATRYPLHDASLDRLLNLEMRINDCRSRRMGAEPLEWESPELLGLTAFVGLQSRGMPMAVDIDGPAAAQFAEGERYFNTRRGQLDLACTHCHDGLVGQRLRGDLISQGQINGFPIHRLMWGGMGSRHRMFAWCNTSLRAEPDAPGSDIYLALELYLAWRGSGLAMEAPAVRR